MLCLCLLVSHSRAGTVTSPPCSLSTCTHVLLQKQLHCRERHKPYELEGLKRVRNLKYLIKQLPCCAPPSSDSPPCAGHKLMSPGDVTGICSSFPHVLTARHRELWLVQQPDPAHFGSAAVLLTTGSLAVPEGGVLCTEGCGHYFGSWHLN